MIKLIKNAYVYAPRDLGLNDVLIIGDKIAKIGKNILGYDDIAEIHDLNGKLLTPGFIDLHVHVTGGGGEQGYSSRVPEIQLSQLVENGVTTVLGLLGTDGVTRSLENLHAKVQGLCEEGITCYMLTGAYQYPSPTLTGSVVRDINLITPVVGVKVALSDHRSSNMTDAELIRLASDARLGGMISGKAGIVVIHMGNGKKRLDSVFNALENTEIPIKTFLPTHMSRNDYLMEHAIRFAKLGGVFDVTAHENPTAEDSCSRQIASALAAGVSIENITMSSDACGSQPRFDENGQCIGLTYTSPKVLLQELKCCVQQFKIPLPDALSLLTLNPAKVLEKTGVKGEIAVGADADLIVFNEHLDIQGVFAKGAVAVAGGKAVMKGRFEI